MIALYICRFCENEDVSSIAFQTFNSRSNNVHLNKYPTFSFCFTDKIFEKGDIFNPGLKENYGVDKSNYLKFLKGELEATYQHLQVDYDRVVQHPDDFVVDFHTRDTKRNEFNTWTTRRFIETNNCWRCRNKTLLESKIGKSSFPFIVRYQDFQTLCITKNTSFDPSIDVKFDQVTLDLTKLKGAMGWDQLKQT